MGREREQKYGMLSLEENCMYCKYTVNKQQSEQFSINIARNGTEYKKTHNVRMLNS